MSLINDALKRATKSPAIPGGSSDSGEPMLPVESHQSVALPRYFFPTLLCIFCGALWFIVQGWDARRQAELQPDLVRVHARESQSTPATLTEAGPASDLAGSELVSATPVGPTGDHPPIPDGRDFSLDDPAASAAPAPAPPALRLQGIFYRASGASAVVNAETVFVGDVVSGARVKAIDRGSVTLERDGQTQILSLR